jgi:predicted amidophosphoribosyltransferase
MRITQESNREEEQLENEGEKLCWYCGANISVIDEECPDCGVKQ